MNLRYIPGKNYGRDPEAYVKGSRFFKYKELIGSETAVARGIVNSATEQIWQQLEILTVECLDKIRNKFGPININSCYRNPTLNSATGGSPSSNHCKGIAADIEPMDNKFRNVDVLIWCYENIGFWELIAEKFGPHPRDGWVHIAYNRTRRECGLKILRNAPGSRVEPTTIDKIIREYK